MNTFSHAVVLLTLILAAYFLTGCSTLNTSIENGIGELPGQRVYVTTTVYRW